MASPTTAVEPLLASSMRVLRNITPIEDLIAAWPSLKEKSLHSPPMLTDSERRLFLDLPNEDMETVNISVVTSLSREQLIAKAVSDRESLTQEEVVLLQDRFWTPRTREEHSRGSRARAEASPEDLEEYYTALTPAYAPNEEDAFGIGIQEFWKRKQAAENEKRRAAANLVLPDAKEWIQYLYRQDRMNWGFVFLYDAAAQKLDPARLEDCSARMGGFFQHTLMYNGSKDIIDRKWKLLSFNAPNTASAPTSPVSDSAISSKTDYQVGATLRKAFQDILKDPQEYENAEDVAPTNTYPHHFKNGITGSGLLTNTFLVIDPACIDSVLDDGKWFDDMRILAFEADFPVEGREYVEGYQGFTWVRLDQLVYNFYELRLLKADEVGMDKIWKAAQESRHRAFVSMDPEEALSWTTSCSMRGFTRDSVLGRRWYAIKDAKQKLATAQLGAKTDDEPPKQNPNAIHSQLPYVDNAPFNATRHHRERYCLPDTRVQLLNEITTWGNTPDGPCIFWLNSQRRGTGKATVARTVARQFDQESRSGASFFFDARQADLRHAEKFCTTIASQLARALPTLKHHVCEAVDEDHLISTRGLDEQWRKLIFQPLSKLENLSSHTLPIILVIGELDECRWEDRRVILRLLAQAKDLPTIKLKILLTSSTESDIEDELSAISELAHQDLILRHNSNDIIEHDILKYTQHEFDRIRKKRGLPSDWPKAEDINTFVQGARGLFFSVYIFCLQIDRHNAEKQLSRMLEHLRSIPPPPGTVYEVRSDSPRAFIWRRVVT